MILLGRGEDTRGPLRELEASQWLTPAALREDQGLRLKRLIAAACARHPWYAAFLRERGVSPAQIGSLDELTALPLTDKQDLRRFGAGLLAAGGLPRGTTIRKTGGSTGAPCLVYADRRASAHTLAARALCQGWHGLEPGARQLRFWGRPLESGRRQARLKDLLLGRIRLDSLALGPDRLPETLRRVRRFDAEYCYGYASLLRLFAEQIPEGGRPALAPRLKVVISTSETLTPRQQAEMSRRFGCRVVNEYGCSEVDIIAFECPAGGLHVVAGNHVVEVLRDGTEPEGFGQVVVTDLNNRLLPVVRYQTGDLAPLGLGACSCGRGWPTLQRVLGRSQGQYIVLPDGRRVHSQFVVYMVEELVAQGAPIVRFRIVQDRPDRLTVRVAVAADAALDAEGMLAYFRREGTKVLGENMAWRLQPEPASAFAQDHVNKYSHFESTLTDG